MNAMSRLRLSDYLLLTGMCVVLYGFSAAYERVLTAHETVHCVNVREMLASGDWVIPTYGGRPWLERPPLPHWLTALAAAPFGAGEQVWTYRLGSHLMGLGCVLLTAWMGSVWFGRGMGILSGAVLATMLEFYQYATVTEADIGLCLVITGALAFFVKVEFGGTPPPSEPLSPGEKGESVGFLGSRSWALAGFFLFLGLTNTAKGLFFGSFFILVPVGGYLLLNASWAGIRRYVWLWGWVLCLGAAASWGLAAWQRYPDIVDLWHSDYIGRLNKGFMREPVWYYLGCLPMVLFPWFLPAMTGLFVTAREANRPATAARWLWCWAWLPIVFFSIPQGKHHHYLLHCLAPWAILGAIGARHLWTWLTTAAPRWVRQPLLPVTLFSLAGSLALYLFRHRLPGMQGGWLVLALACSTLFLAFWWGAGQRRETVAFAAVFGALIVGYCAAWVFRGNFLNPYEEDLAFIHRTRQRVPADTPIFIKCDPHPLNGSWLLFYLGERTVFLHNLTFLRDENIREQTLYLVGRMWDEEELQKYGRAERLDQSARTRGEINDRDRYALFRFTYRPDLTRVPVSRVRINPCQATSREKGPYLE